MSYLGLLGKNDCNSFEPKKAMLRSGGYVDIPRLISFIKVRSYQGRGIEFKHKDKKMHKIWHQFVKDNDFFSFMFESNRIKGETGAVFITNNRLKGGKVVLGRPSPLLASGIAFSFSTPTLAVINRQIAIANKQLFVRQVFDTEKVVTTMWDRNYNGEFTLYNEIGKIPEDMQIELGKYDESKGAWTYYHNLGFVPVTVIYNEPFTPSIPILTAGFYYQSPATTPMFENVQGFDYSQVKDTARCSKLIIQLDNLYIHLNRLVELYKPRLLITTNNSQDGNRFFQDKQRQQGMSGNNSNLNDADIFVSSNANKVSVDQVSTPNTIDHYQNQIVATYVDIFKVCGLDWITQSGTQRTGQESFSQFKGFIEQVNFDRNYLTNKWIEIIVKSFMMLGHDLEENREDWSFQVKKNLVTDEATLVDTLIKQYELKLKTPAQILSVIEGIDEDYAEHIVEENFAWFDKNKEEADFPQINPPRNANVSGVKSASLPGSKEKGGRPIEQGGKKDEE